MPPEVSPMRNLSKFKIQRRNIWKYYRKYYYLVETPFIPFEIEGTSFVLVYSNGKINKFFDWFLFKA